MKHIGIWRVEQPAHQESKRIVDGGGKTVAGIVSNDYDAKYIVHTANAYPKLIEALRALLHPLHAKHQEADAAALLRELGEAE
jgi:hypothetical protein